MHARGLGRARKLSPHRKDSNMYLSGKWCPTPEFSTNLGRIAPPSSAWWIRTTFLRSPPSMVGSLDRQSTPAEHAPRSPRNRRAPLRSFWRILPNSPGFWRILSEFPRIRRSSPRRRPTASQSVVLRGGYDQGYQVSPSDVNGKFGKKCVGVGSISELSSAANSRKSAENDRKSTFSVRKFQKNPKN